LNKIVLKRVLPPAIAALLTLGGPSEAQTFRPKPQKPSRTALAQPAKPAPVPVVRQAPISAYASAHPGCTVGRKRLWTDAGWIVRRVTSCP
jgi:hypothetical protein